jgi:YVTN family beta-propeller protein
MKQIFLLEDGILTYLAFAAIADGKKVYEAESVHNIVSVITTATNTVIATIPVGIFPYGVTELLMERSLFQSNTPLACCGDE